MFGSDMGQLGCGMWESGVFGFEVLMVSLGGKWGGGEEEQQKPGTALIKKKTPPRVSLFEKVNYQERTTVFASRKDVNEIWKGYIYDF